MRAQPEAVAAVDCGTNSTRLLVADGAGRQLERVMKITRLGEGVDRSGMLSPSAIGRTLEVLEGYRRAMDAHGVRALRAIATSAARDAGNREAFFGPAREILGVEPELLGGEEEGVLSFKGATSDLRNETLYLVVDIGGGSTELVVGRVGERPGVVSMDIGCVRATERFLRHDPPSGSELAAARRAVEELLTDAEEGLSQIREAEQLVGVAGTVSTLASVSAGMADYEHGDVHHRRLTRAEVEQLVISMGSESREVRLKRPGLEAARADVIVGGAVVLAAIMSRLRFEHCLVSESDILDGLVMSLLDSWRPEG